MPTIRHQSRRARRGEQSRADPSAAAPRARSFAPPEENSAQDDADLGCTFQIEPLPNSAQLIWPFTCSPVVVWPVARTSGAQLFCESDAQKWQPAEEEMLDRCANPSCLRRFLRLGQGRLFLVEAEGSPNFAVPQQPTTPYFRIRPRRVDRYWLCDRCSETWTLVYARQTGISLAPLRYGPFSTTSQNITKRTA
jgi:hypothetical protein